MMPWLVCIVTFFTPTAALLAAYQMVIFWYAAVDTLSETYVVNFAR